MTRRRSEAGEARGQTISEFVGADEPGERAAREGGVAEQEDVVAEGIGAAGSGPGAAGSGPGLGVPSMGAGYERISTRIFRVDVLREYEELEQGLKLSKPAHRADYSELVDALDEATDNARRAHLILVNAKVALEAFELDTTVFFSDMRAQATAVLEREKESGYRKKAITNGDVEAMMAQKFADEWRSVSEVRAKARRMVEHLERLSDLWRDRRASLDTLVKGARRV